MAKYSKIFHFCQRRRARWCPDIQMSGQRNNQKIVLVWGSQHLILTQDWELGQLVEFVQSLYSLVFYLFSAAQSVKKKKTWPPNSMSWYITVNSPEMSLELCKLSPEVYWGSRRVEPVCEYHCLPKWSGALLGYSSQWKLQQNTKIRSLLETYPTDKYCNNFCTNVRCLKGEANVVLQSSQSSSCQCVCS